MVDVGDKIKQEGGRWSFGGDVHLSFDEHVRKSVPLYYEGHRLILQISDFFQQPNAIFYDVGCSTGALTYELAKRHQKSHVRLVGCDTEEGMVETARSRCQKLDSVEIKCQDILDLDMEKSNFVTAYYTLQFIHPSVRQAAVNRIFESLKRGGAFIMFEKVRCADGRFQDIITQTYQEYKRDQGYTDTQIAEKARSLKGVLEPYCSHGNVDMLEKAGFKDVMTIFKYTCFEGFLAIK